MLAVAVVVEDAFGFVERNGSVNLVGKNRDAFFVGDFHDAVQRFVVHDFAGGVVGVVEDNHFGVFVDERLELGRVNFPLVFQFGPEEFDFGAYAFGD